MSKTPAKKSPSHKPPDILAIKTAASGRWREILPALAGIAPDFLDGKHHPCPKCGGTDRFRFLGDRDGGCYCNQCFAEKNHDGIASIRWLTGSELPTVLAQLTSYLHLDPAPSHGTTASSPSTPKKAPSKPHKARVWATAEGIVHTIHNALVAKEGPGVRFVRSWKYPTFSVLRFDLPTPAGEKQRKEFRPVHQAPLGTSGTLGWALGYPPGPRPLYRLPEIQAAADTDSSLLTIHGGEKAADAAAASILLPSTTNAGGEEAIRLTDWGPAARFQTVAIVTDNDSAGERFGQAVGAILRTQRPEDQVIKIIRLPGLPPKGDVVEWIAAGGTLEEFLKIVEKTPAADIKPIDATGIKPNEAPDDPHRLARVNLERYATRHDGRTIVFWRDEWYAWKRNRYRKIPEKELRAKIATSIKAEFDRLNIVDVKSYEERKALGLLDPTKDKGPPEVQKVSTHIVGSVLQATSGMTVLSGEIEHNTWLPTKQRLPLISLANGLLNVEALLAGAEPEDFLRPNSPSWFSTVSLPYPFDIAAECPKWLAFLEYNLELDPERIKLLQEWAGYLLLPYTGEQKFMILEGEGANGKSVFCAGIESMLGKDNVSHVPLEIFGERFQLTQTIGKLCNIASDAGEIERAAEGHLKSFTAGNPMTFDRKGMAPLDLAPTARLMVACNNRPRFNDHSDGVFRRMLIVPWRVQIEPKRRIKGMDQTDWWERSGELSGIFNWAVAGLHRLRAQNGFTYSQVMNDTLEEYREEMNPARVFLCENLERSDGSVVRTDHIYRLYRRWCEANGHKPMASGNLGKEVMRVFRGTKKVRRGGKSDRFNAYEGIAYSQDEIAGETTADKELF
ncbi:MAG: phage/plasmid primase, P4 family [Planctomycetaceae bacterium]